MDRIQMEFASSPPNKFAELQQAIAESDRDDVMNAPSWYLDSIYSNKTVALAQPAPKPVRPIRFIFSQPDAIENEFIL